MIDELDFQHMFEHHATMMVIINAATGTVEKVNRAAEKFYGIRSDNFIGMNFNDICASWEAEQEHLISGRERYKIQNHITAGKIIKPVELYASPVVINQSCYTFLIVHDISERNKTEKLLAYRRRYEQLISTLSTYFIRPDHHEIDQAIQHTLQILAEFINTEICAIILISDDQSTLQISHMWSRDQALYKYQGSVYPIEIFPDDFSALFRGDHIDIHEIRLNLETGSLAETLIRDTGIQALLLVPIVSAGLVTGGIGIASTEKSRKWSEDAHTLLQVVGEMITNVLARKRSEHALRASEQKYRKFFEEDLTADFIAEPDGRIKFCNPAFIRIFAFESENMAFNSNLKDLDGSEGKLNRALAQLPEGKLLQGQEFELQRKDGEAVQVICNIRGIFDEQGNLTEILGYLFDITAHKKVEEQFRGAQRMEAIGRLAGGIAHDFNNLLTVINGYSDLLLKDNELSSMSKAKIEQIKNAGERAATLTGQLLAFSRKQIVKPKILNLNRLILNIDKMLRRLIGEHIDIVNILDDSLGNIEIDPGQIEQVIINLAVNARDAMPEGGKLIIETSNVFLDEQYSMMHQPINPGSYIMLAVRDTGIGMSPDIQAHIFEPFFTTKEKGKGTGLGLSTIYGIIKQCKGYIWVESALNKGSTFFIYFPRAHGPIENYIKEKADQESLKGSEIVLVVEDDHSVRQLTVSFLKKFGYRVYEAEDANHALKICTGCKSEIDLAVIDVVMPGISGKRLSDILKEQYPRIKVLYISGYTDDEIVHYGVLNSGVEFLQKPFNAENLGKKIRQILDS